MYFIDTDAVVILDVFGKTTRRTPAARIDVCRRRLRSYMAAVTGKETER